MDLQPVQSGASPANTPPPEDSLGSAASEDNRSGGSSYTDQHIWREDPSIVSAYDRFPGKTGRILQDLARN
eukprot:11372898-Alexandrium_andersonii.AAC.1